MDVKRRTSKWIKKIIHINSNVSVLFIKDYQDLDHFAPVINYLKGDKIFIFLENKELIQDKRPFF